MLQSKFSIPGLAAAFFRFGVLLLLFIGSAVDVENSALDVSRISIELLGISAGEGLGKAEHSEKRRVVEGRFVGEGRFEGEAAPSEKQSKILRREDLMEGKYQLCSY